jgi:hypothetical protein
MKNNILIITVLSGISLCNMNAQLSHEEIEKRSHQAGHVQYPGQINYEWYFDSAGNRLKDYWPVGKMDQEEKIKQHNESKKQEYERPIREQFPKEHQDKPDKEGLPKRIEDIQLVLVDGEGDIKTQYLITAEGVHKGKMLDYKGKQYVHFDQKEYTVKESEMLGTAKVVENNEIVTVALMKGGISLLMNQLQYASIENEKTFKGLFDSYVGITEVDKQSVLRYLHEANLSAKAKEIEKLNSKTSRKWTEKELDQLKIEYYSKLRQARIGHEVVDVEKCLEFIKQGLEQYGYKGKVPRHVYNFVWSVTGCRRVKMGKDKEDEQEELLKKFKPSYSNGSVAELLVNRAGLSVADLDLIYEWAVKNHKEIRAYIESQYSQVK